METVERDFSPKGVKFYYIYKALAHPETNGYITPFTLEERLMHVAEAKEKLGTRITWLCDTMSNDLKHSLGNAPNSEFVVDPNGKIVVSRQWSSPHDLRNDLARLVGRPTRTTSVAEIGMRPIAPPKTAPTGVVPRLALTGNMSPVHVNPAAGLGLLVQDEETFYVKLRAEIDSAYFQRGTGKLYLGFFLDPLYKVHWNNRAAAVSYEIVTPRGISITPSTGIGPDIKEDADADPREFLVDVTGSSSEPIKLSVKYFACDDAETFCKPVTQHYEIRLERDRDGGNRRSGRSSRGGRFSNNSRPGGVGQAGVRGGPGQPRVRPQSRDRISQQPNAALSKAIEMFRDHDTNRDGKLDREEVSRNQWPSGADTDQDETISRRELVDWLSQPGR